MGKAGSNIWSKQEDTKKEGNVLSRFYKEYDNAVSNSV